MGAAQIGVVLHAVKIQKRRAAACKFQRVLLQGLFHQCAVMHRTPAGIRLDDLFRPAAAGHPHRLLPGMQELPRQTDRVVAVRHRQPGELRGAQRAAVHRCQPLCQRGVQPVLLRHLQLCALPVQLPEGAQRVLLQRRRGLAQHGKAPGKPFGADGGDGRFVHRHHHKVRVQGNALLHRGAYRHAVLPVHFFGLFLRAAKHGAQLEPLRQRLRDAPVKQRPPAGAYYYKPQLSHLPVPPEYAFAAPLQTGLRPAAG